MRICSIHPEVRLADFRIVFQLGDRPLPDDAAGLHHVTPVGHAERGEDVLLDGQDRDVLLADLTQHAKQLVDDHGEKPGDTIRNNTARHRSEYGVPGFCIVSPDFAFPAARNAYFVLGFSSLHPEVGLTDFRVVLLLGDGALPDDAAGLHHVTAVRHAEGSEDVLLNQEDRDALLADLAEHAEELIHHHWSQAQAHLVDREEFRGG